MALNSKDTAETLILLLNRSGQGDRAAFAALYQATSAKLFGLALRILHRHDLAEEAIQDVYVKIWHHAPSYRADKAAVMTWMTTITRNRCLDLLRSLPPEHGLNEEQSFDEWASDDLGPLEKATSNSEARALLQCMKQLAPLQRQAIALSYFQGMAHEQLARQLVQPIGTVKTWIRRGLQVLRSCMGAL